MQNPIGILGIGQAGGNVAKEAAKAGFLAAAINTSPEDLQAVSDAVKHLYQVPGEVGAGKDRNVGKRVVQERWQDMVGFVSSVFGSPETKAVGIAYSLGGGTGSSVGPFLGDILTEALPGVTIFFVAIMPHDKEAASAHVNATEAFSELSGIEKAGATFILDNQQVMSLNPNASKGELYEIGNKAVIKQLRYLVEITQKASAAGNFDRKDLMQVLATRGFATIGQAAAAVTVKDMADARLAIARNVMASWEKAVYAPVEYQGMGPVRAAILYEGPEGVTRHIDTGSIFADLGEPFEVFEGTYNRDGEGIITTLLTGLPWPAGRMARVEDRLASRREVIEKQIQTAYGARFEAQSLGWASGLKKSPAISLVKPQAENTQANIMDKLARYGTR